MYSRGSLASGAPLDTMILDSEQRLLALSTAKYILLALSTYVSGMNGSEMSGVEE